MDLNSSTPPAPPQISSSGTNALMMPQQPQQQMPAAPDHRQTVAALRHFMAVVDELQTLLKDPSLGKSDIRSQIIDGTSKLVAQRMISPANAVKELAGVPDDPRQQGIWVKQMLQKTMQAQNNVLDHHSAGNAGTLDWKIESQHQPGSKDDHMQTMSGLGSLYKQ